MHEYLSEVKTVFCNNVVIGYLARRSVLFGITPDIPNSWCATRRLVVPEWVTGFDTRREAREFLQQEEL